MSDTAIIDEVRSIRRQIAEECGNDLRKITEHAKEVTRRFLGQSKLSVAISSDSEYQISNTLCLLVSDEVDS